ncbi:Suppressor of the cold-sensitive snRNP bioproteinsis mutant brr1-1, partial [Perkinsus olseni]
VPSSVAHARKRRFKRGTAALADCTQTTAYSTELGSSCEAELLESSEESSREGFHDLSSTWKDDKDSGIFKESCWWSSQCSELGLEQSTTIAYSVADTLRLSIGSKLRDLQEEVMSTGRAKMYLLEEIKGLKSQLDILRIEYQVEVDRGGRLAEQLAVQAKKEEERKRQVEFLVEQCKKLRDLVTHQAEQKRLTQQRLNEWMKEDEMKLCRSSSGWLLIVVIWLGGSRRGSCFTDGEDRSEECVQAAVLRQDLHRQEAVIERLRKDLVESKARVLELEARSREATEVDSAAAEVVRGAGSDICRDEDSDTSSCEQFSEEVAASHCGMATRKGVLWRATCARSRHVAWLSPMRAPYRLLLAIPICCLGTPDTILSITSSVSEGGLSAAALGSAMVDIRSLPALLKTSSNPKARRLQQSTPFIEECLNAPRAVDTLRHLGVQAVHTDTDECQLSHEELKAYVEEAAPALGLEVILERNSEVSLQVVEEARDGDTIHGIDYSKTAAAVNDARADEQWNLDLINLPEAWAAWEAIMAARHFF